MTSQIFSNIYLNKFDQFAKHQLRAEWYVRYADDFVILHRDKMYLKEMTQHINAFLNTTLKLQLHPDKVFIRKFRQGIDFLGYVCLPYHRVLRTKTKRRMIQKIADRKQAVLRGKVSQASFYQTIQSYIGMLQHANGYRLIEMIRVARKVETTS